jgi:hypothetical protein
MYQRWTVGVFWREEHLELEHTILVWGILGSDDHEFHHIWSGLSIANEDAFRKCRLERCNLLK